MLFWRKPVKPRRTGGERKQADSTASLTKEIAGIATDLYAPLQAFLGVRANDDPILASRQPDSHYAYPYGLFEEALDKDAHLSALITQRKAAVLSWDSSVVPADSSPEAKLVADAVEAALDNIGGSNGQASSFTRDLSELLDAVPFGLAVSEVVWEEKQTLGMEGEGGQSPRVWLVPAKLLSRHPRRFIFDTSGGLKLLSTGEPSTGKSVQPRKFIVFAPYGRHENPYGLPALRSVWWFAYFKRQAMKFWVMFAEKFGTPTTVLKHPLGATDKEKSAYRRIIGSIQQETGLVVPDGVELQLLEAQRSGSSQTYRQLVEFCNAEMSKAIVGQTLTSEAGERGARSLGEVHYAVRQDIVRQDAKALQSAINGQLVRWFVDLNFPPEMRLYPSWQLSPPQQEDLALQLDIDEFFSAQGLAVDETQLYARYHRTQPKAAGTTQGATK